MSKLLEKYIRYYPTVFCPGCGCGTVLNVLVHAFEKLKIDLTKVVTVSGIGCSSWIPSPYLKTDTLHVTHGRPIAFATGIKIMKPELSVIVIAGDGDIAGIGCNHLIHGAKRNIDLSVFMVNNMIYGMTGGQVAPTTPKNVKTATTPFGNIEEPLDIVKLVSAAGASYVARWTTYHVFNLRKSMEEAIRKKGFSFIEIVSQCPQHFGRRFGKSAIELLEMFRDNSVSVHQSNKNEKEGKIVVGKFVDIDRPEYVSELIKMHQRIRNNDEN